MPRIEIRVEDESVGLAGYADPDVRSFEIHDGRLIIHHSSDRPSLEYDVEDIDRLAVSVDEDEEIHWTGYLADHLDEEGNWVGPEETLAPNEQGDEASEDTDEA